MVSGNYRREERGSTDTFECMLLCCGLWGHLATCPEAIDFLVLVAKSTLPRWPQRSRPRYLALQQQHKKVCGGTAYASS